MTPVVGGGGGASRAAAEGAGPEVWRRSLGLSVPAPAAAAAAAAAAAVPYLLWPGCLPIAARRPSIPSRLPSCWPGAQVRLAALPRPRVLLGIFPSRGRPLRTVSAPRLPWPPGGGPGGRDGSLPIPLPLPAAPLLPAPRPSPGSLSQASASPSWGWSQASPSRADYTIPGSGGGGHLPEPPPHTCPRDALPGRGQRPSTTAGGESFTLWSASVDMREMRGDGG